MTCDKTTDKTGAPATVTQRGKEFTITVDGRPSESQRSQIAVIGGFSFTPR